MSAARKNSAIVVDESGCVNLPSLELIWQENKFHICASQQNSQMVVRPFGAGNGWYVKKIKHLANPDGFPKAKFSILSRSEEPRSGDTGFLVEGNRQELKELFESGFSTESEAELGGPQTYLWGRGNKMRTARARGGILARPRPA